LSRWQRLTGSATTIFATRCRITHALGFYTRLHAVECEFHCRPGTFLNVILLTRCTYEGAEAKDWAESYGGIDARYRIMT